MSTPPSKAALASKYRNMGLDSGMGGVDTGLITIAAAPSCGAGRTGRLRGGRRLGSPPRWRPEPCEGRLRPDPTGRTPAHPQVRGRGQLAAAEAPPRDPP